MSKRCGKGKSCGATCISRLKICLKDLPQREKDLGKVSGVVLSLSKGPSPSQKEAITLSGEGSEKVGETLDYLSKVETKDVEGVVSADKINWNAGLEKGAELMAAGRSGAFVEVPTENLAKGLGKEFPGGVGIKYGEITAGEVEILKKVGESGAGPRMIAARIENGTTFENMGMVAMERIPGRTLKSLYEGDEIKIKDLEDNYLRGIAKLHRAGVAHGDAHLGNAILQPNGEVKFIDFGHSRLSYMRALAEALRATSESGSPVWNLDVFEGASATKMRENLKKYRSEFRDYKQGLRTTEEMEQMAVGLIQKLYEGI